MELKKLIVLAALLAVVLLGCPHHLVEQIDRLGTLEHRVNTSLAQRDLGKTIEQLKSEFPSDVSQIPADSTLADLALDSLSQLATELSKREREQAVEGESAGARTTKDSTQPGFSKSTRKTRRGNQNDSSNARTITNGGDSSSPEKVSTPRNTEKLLTSFQLSLLGLKDELYPDEIQMSVSIKTSAGQAVTGLAPPYFKPTVKGETHKKYWRMLTDSCGGVKTKIREFTVEEIRDENAFNHSITFVLDHSGSMGDRVIKLREATQSTLMKLKSGDFGSVVHFAGKPAMILPPTSDSAVLRRDYAKGNRGEVGGGTRIYDAVAHAIKETRKLPSTAQRIIVLFTDGMDGGSKIKLDSAIRLCRANNVKVFSVGYGFADTGSSRSMFSLLFSLGSVEMGDLIKLSDYTGGQAYNIISIKELPFVFADIYRSLKNYYLIRYRPPVCGGKHKAEVTLYIPEVGSISRVGGGYDKSVFTDMSAEGTVVFSNIEFETGRAEVLSKSKSEVEKIAVTLLSHPDFSLIVQGHTDDVGDEHDNQKLSEDRAESVAKILIQVGVEKRRIATVGFGESNPLHPNDSEDNRRLNRRTEFVLKRR